MIPKCSNLVKGMTLGYPINGMALRLKGQKSRIRLGLGLGLTAIQRGFELYEYLLKIYFTLSQLFYHEHRSTA